MRMGEYGRLPQDVQSNVAAVFNELDERFMVWALELARTAGRQGEVPVGAVIVSEGCIAGEGWNRPVATSDPTAHAEMLALREAAGGLNNYRLSGATLYCTLEPCVMCAGAIVLARISRVVFAARDLRFGAVRSKFALADSPLLNHRARIQEGLLAAQASGLLAEFFDKARQKNSSEK